MDGTGGASFGEEQERSREAFVPAFLVERIFMRTLTFPSGPLEEVPSCRVEGGCVGLGVGRGQYRLYIAAKEVPVLLKRAPDLLL